MSDLREYLEKRGISEQTLAEAEAMTQAMVDAYTLRAARKAQNMTQVELAEVMGVSQNRVSRIERGDMGSMSVDTIRRYVEGVGGSLKMEAVLPGGSLSLA